MSIDDQTMARIKASSPFAGVAEEDMEALVDQLHAYTRAYAKDTVIRHAGDELDFYPVILEGEVQSAMPRGESEQIIARFLPGESFAEAVPGGPGVCPVNIRALCDTVLLQIPAQGLKHCAHPSASIVQANLMQMMARRITWLSKKIALLNEPRLRKRILLFLEDQDKEEDGSIRVYFSRKDMAEYLGVNDKALLREIKRMQEEGVLWVEDRRFRILRR